MKKQKGSGKQRWTESVSRYRPNKSARNSTHAHYPIPKDGIVMHIEELKEKLKAIQSKFGFDPSVA